MANSITGAIGYLNELDEGYKAASATGILNAPSGAIRRIAGSVTTFDVQTITLVGLGTYSKTAGFPAGDVTIAWEPFTYSQDRGRAFTVDAVDAADAMLQFGTVGRLFQKRHTIPEIDAYRIAKIATTVGTDVAATISTGADVAAALNLAYNTLLEAEVPETDLVLFITPTLLNAVKTQIRNADVPVPVLDVASIQSVPASRMYTAITVNAGATGSAGGWARATGAEGVQFILMDKNAVFADVKHQALRVFDPNTNQTLDAWLFQFRVVHDLFVYPGMEDGVYVCTATATAS